MAAAPVTSRTVTLPLLLWIDALRADRTSTLPKRLVIDSAPPMSLAVTEPFWF